MKNVFRKPLAVLLTAAALAFAGLQPAHAVRTVINGQQLKHARKLPINAGDLLVAETAADTGNNNMFACANGGILLMHNTHASNAYTITITTATDIYGRTGDITTYSLAAGEIHAIWIPPTGIEQTSGSDVGKVYISASNAAVKFAFLTEPDNARAR